MAVFTWSAWLGLRHRRSPAEGAANVLHQQNEVEGVGGTVLQLGDEMAVERAGVTGLGVDQECPAADVFREREESKEHVLKQACAESSAFMMEVHAEAGEEGDRSRIAPASFAQPS